MLGQHFGIVEGDLHLGKGLSEHQSSQDDLDIQNMDGTQMESAQGLCP